MTEVEPRFRPMNGKAIHLVEKFWALMATNDFRLVGSLLADDFVLDWPQSGERIRGRDNYAAMNEQYPTTTGRWSFAINRLVGNDDEAVSDVSVTDDLQHARAISFFAIRDGKIVRIIEFWPEPLRLWRIESTWSSKVIYSWKEYSRSFHEAGYKTHHS